MWQHNFYYVCVTFSVVRYVGLTSNIPHHTERHAHIINVMLPRLTFKNFKLSDFLKFNYFNEAPTNSLMMIY
jgi:hypothetical protein